MTSESGSALDISGFQNIGVKTVTVFSLGLRSEKIYYIGLERNYGGWFKMKWKIFLNKICLKMEN